MIGLRCDKKKKKKGLNHKSSFFAVLFSIFKKIIFKMYCELSGGTSEDDIVRNYLVHLLSELPLAHL